MDDFDKDGSKRKLGKIEIIFFRLSILVVCVTLASAFSVLVFKDSFSFFLFMILVVMIIFSFVNWTIVSKYYDNIHAISRLDHFYHCSTRGIVKLPTYTEEVQGLKFCLFSDRLVDVQATIMKNKDEVIKRNIAYERIVSFWESFFYYLS